MTPRRAAAAALALLLLGATAAGAAEPGFADLVERARAARAASDHASTEALARRALDLRPGDVAALALLADAQAFQGRPAEAIATIREARGRAPGDRDLTMAEARFRAWNREFREAEALARAVLSADPADGEAETLLARIPFYAGDPATADRRFAAILDRRPDDPDALIGAGDAARAQGRTEEARRLFARAADHAASSAEAQRRLASLDAPQGRRWRLDAGVSTSRFARRSLDRWHEGALSLGHRITPTTGVHAGVEHASRFGRRDSRFEVGAEHRASPVLAVRGAVAVTPSAQVRERWSLAGEADVRLREGDGTVGASGLILGARTADYRTGSIETFSTGLAQDVLGGAVRLSARWIHVEDDGVWSRGWATRIEWRATDRLRLDGGLSLAPETDDGAVARTAGAAAGFVLDLDDAVSLRGGYARDDRRGGYVRHSLTGGVTVRF